MNGLKVTRLLKKCSHSTAYGINVCEYTLIRSHKLIYVRCTLGIRHVRFKYACIRRCTLFYTQRPQSLPLAEAQLNPCVKDQLMCRKALVHKTKKCRSRNTNLHIGLIYLTYLNLAQIHFLEIIIISGDREQCPKVLLRDSCQYFYHPTTFLGCKHIRVLNQSLAGRLET